MILNYGHVATIASLCASLAACTVEPAPHENPLSWRTTVGSLPDAAIPIATDFKTATIPLRRPLAPPRQTTTSPPLRHELRGVASYYWQEQKTSSGERFDKHALTAAHRTLPFGTRVRVTNRNNGKSVVVRINDRGPFKPGRVIDLSLAAAGLINMRDIGLAPVAIEILP